MPRRKECDATLSGWHSYQPRSSGYIACLCGKRARDQAAAAKLVDEIHNGYFPKRIVRDSEANRQIVARKAAARRTALRRAGQRGME